MILFLGDSPAPDDIRGVPFTGSSGRLLQGLLTTAGLLREDDPPRDWKPEFAAFGLRRFLWARSDHRFAYALPSLAPTKVAERRPFLEEVRPALRAMLAELNPDAVIGLGATVLELLAGTAYKISEARGIPLPMALIDPGRTFMPAFAPGALRKDWKIRSTLVADIRKAAGADAIIPPVELWLRPTLDDMCFWWQRYGSGAKRLAVDIETSAYPHITCVGFAADGAHAICVPFADWSRVNGCAWPTLADEISAWAIIAEWLDSPIPKVFHNGSYDVAWLWYAYGLRIRAWTEDTMLMQHCVAPELPKSLAFLGAAYGNPPMPWKAWHTNSEKREG